MGFTNGFLGGLTLTYSVLYLTLHLHKANRANQHNLLLHSNHLLASHYDPLQQQQQLQPSPFDQDLTIYELPKPGLTDLLKDTWNAEVERLVRTMQTTDWNAKRQELETLAGGAWDRLRGSDVAANAADALNPQSAADGVKDAVDALKDTANGKTRQKRLLEL